MSGNNRNKERYPTDYTKYGLNQAYFDDHVVFQELGVNQNSGSATVYVNHIIKTY